MTEDRRDIVEWIRWFVRNTNDPADFRWKAMTDAANEIERLRDVVDDLGLTPEAARAGLERSRANKRDAERYRWIRSNRFGVKLAEIYANGDRYTGGETLDRAIDEAMSKTHNDQLDGQAR